MNSSLMKIEIDLEVYKLLEIERISFDEKFNDILRRILKLREIGKRSVNTSELVQPRSTRSRGQYTVVLGEKTLRSGGLKGLLKEVLLEAETMKPGLLEALSKHRTQRGRRIVARKATEIYPNKPQLLHCAEQLKNGWWYDTNISQAGCQRHIEVVAELVGAIAGKVSMQSKST